MPAVFHDLPDELQGCCAHYLDTMSAGRFGQASRTCWQLVDGQLVAEKAARRSRPFEKSKYGAMVTYCNTSDNSKLITFSSTDGGAAQLYKCSCAPDKECGVGRAFTNVARHLASRGHWKHWRLVAFGEPQPTNAEWLAFQATLPGEMASARRI